MGHSMSGGWTGNAREAVGEIGDAARRGYEDAAHRARDAYGDMAERARDAYGQASDYVDAYRHSLEDMVVSHPVKAVAASLAVGVLLGWLIKRS